MNNTSASRAFATSGQLDEGLLAVLARAAEPHLGEVSAEFIARNLANTANTAWAFASMGQVDTVLLAALAWATEARLGELDVQSLANAAWAFATASHEYKAPFPALARAA